MVERWCLSHCLCVDGIHTVVRIYKDKVNIMIKFHRSINPFLLSWGCCDKTFGCLIRKLDLFLMYLEAGKSDLELDEALSVVLAVVS